MQSTRREAKETVPAQDQIWSLICRAARREGSAPALLAPGRPAMTYEELADQTSRFCGWLRGAGIERADRVAVVLGNGPEMAAVFLGATTAAACAPLNPAFTRQDFEYYLADLRARALLVTSDSAPASVEAARALQIPVHVLAPGKRAGELILPVSAREPDRLTAADTALLLHTSGTTARPKLVPLSGSNLTASAAHVACSLALSPADRCLNIMPLFHIHGLVAALLSAIHAGASVVCSDGVFANNFFAWMNEFRPTWYTAVPTMHQTILARADQAREVIGRVKLRFIRSSSSPLPPPVLEQLERTFGAPVIEAYGMTEASHQIASNPLPPGVRLPGSVGLPAGTEAAVMDEEGNLLPAGERGEVVIRGPNITRGYLDNEEANLKSFTNGWFRTGDQGYLDASGYLFLTGRLKELINRGGEKIAPREIDETILKHPAVRQSLAFAIPHRQLGEEIGAAVELHEAFAVSPGEIRAWAAARLPAFKVPRIIRIVDAIPKGPTGKLQRTGLAAKLGIEPLDDTVLGPYEAPRNALEVRIAALWKDLLPGARAGIRDRFEALGGDSLLAVQMLSALSEAEGVEIAPVRFVEAGTIAALAESIEQARGVVDGALRTLQPQGRRPPLFLFPGHDNSLLGLSRLVSMLEPDQPVYAIDLDELGAAAGLAELAGHAARLIAARAAAQSVHLAGICFGGLLAVEAARQLIEAGSRVQTLTLIDCLNPSWQRRAGAAGVLAAVARQWILKLRYHVAIVARMRARSVPSYLADRTRDFLRYHGGRWSARFGTGTSSASKRLALSFGYQPQPLDVPATLIRLPGRRIDASALGWDGQFPAGLKVTGAPFHPNGALAGDNPSHVARILSRELTRL